MTQGQVSSPRNIWTCLPPQPKTVICKAVKTRWGARLGDRDERLGFSLSVISGANHSSLWHVWGGETHRLSPGNCNTSGGKELHLFSGAKQKSDRPRLCRAQGVKSLSLFSLSLPQMHQWKSSNQCQNDIDPVLIVWVRGLSPAGSCTNEEPSRAAAVSSRWLWIPPTNEEMTALCADHYFWGSQIVHGYMFDSV